MLWTPDSSTYFLWPPHFERMPAAGLIYVSLFKVLGFFGLHIFQVNLVLVSYLGAFGCIAFATKRYWPFIPLTALPILWGNFIVHSSSIMSEAWFISALLIALSGVIALIFGAGWRAAGWSGSGLLLGICFKPVAAALIPCIVLAYRFIPGITGPASTHDSACGKSSDFGLWSNVDLWLYGVRSFRASRVRRFRSSPGMSHGC